MKHTIEYSSFKSHFPHSNKRQECPECPVCFNCQLPTDACVNGGSCEPSGLCTCPIGWGAVDCSQPLCGSLSAGQRPQREPGEDCVCDEGWGGVNCNVCQHDGACRPLKGDNATCLKTAIGLKSMHAWCATTKTVSHIFKMIDIPWIENTHVSLTCEWDKKDCMFQFWKDNEEQFYCELSECSQSCKSSNDNDVHGHCEKATCGCMDGAFMCGKEVEWFCKEGKDCWYNGNAYKERERETIGSDTLLMCPSLEYSTLVSVFPDNIQLSCDVGECVNEQDYYDAAPIVILSTIEMMIIGAIFLACILLYFIIKLSASRQKRMFRTGIQLSTDGYDEEEEEEEEDHLTDANRSGESNLPKVALTFSEIHYSVSGKPILSNVNGYIEPGQMLALIGPSGAGKSSLLDILARKHKRGMISGQVLINNTFPTRKQFKKMTGFVDQDDSLMGTLTVRETLMYAAMMQLPRTLSLRTKQKRVEMVLQELGISHIADNPIGIPGQKRGISGGEKRRVSIGKELVTNPSLLFLDEPTSGLDAYNAEVVMECLQRLAHSKKRTIIVTIHQPRSNIFKMFDSVMLLAHGQMLYFGPTSFCSGYFKSIGLPIPNDYNVADYLIDITMKKAFETGSQSPNASPGTPLPLRRPEGDASEALEESASASDAPLSRFSNLMHRRLRNQAEEAGSEELNLLLESNQVRFLLDSFKASRLYKTLIHRLRQASRQRQESQEEGNMNHDHDYYTSMQINFASEAQDSPFSLKQFYHESILSSRTFINLYRNPFLFFAHFIVSVLLALLLGSVFWQVDVDLSGVQNRLGVLFFMCALLGFAATSSLDMFDKERILFMRERDNGYYSPVAYFVAKVIFDIAPLRILPPLVMGSICYYMIGLNAALPVFGKFLLVSVLFNLAATGLCLCFATGFQSSHMSVAHLLANLVMLFSMLFGGFLLNKDHIPAMLSWLQYLSFFNYGYEALIVNELKDITLRDRSIADIQIPGPIILARFGFNGQAFWPDVARLVCFILVSFITSFLFLKYFVKEKR
ncbi:hypothetical protein BDF20DRAFT_811457 [Mycotypha africana]|uniref:uncharacterized protein n=1 Tax=Mycotypha africana TaxID=64632 RepID=UPI002300AFE8|nr:uncharacterized protein BDF20DRAFT_811457 [Mycotypha africana]KAI8990981.1 hypothetical protein BDF20DRAFT_811457 [Mycotypha africana]